MNKPKKAFLHCAATPDYPKSNPAFDMFGAADIEKWHKQRGWREIGYHYVIRRTGVVEVGSRSLDEYGAHVRGHNKDSLGICLIGTRWPTKEQFDSLIALYGLLYEKFGIKWDNWFGHYEVDSQKTCPSFSMILTRKLFEAEHRRLKEDGPRPIKVVQV